MQKQTPKVRRFLDALEALMQEHGMDILHEDGHGAFEIAERGDSSSSWVDGACDLTTWDPVRDGPKRATIVRVAFEWVRTGDVDCTPGASLLRRVKLRVVKRPW